MMRADMAAAYLDYRDTSEFTRAVRRGLAPRPAAYQELAARDSQFGRRPSSMILLHR
jgi:hypothetical protein